MEYEIVTTMEIKAKEVLKKLRRVIEATTMEKPNFSKLGKELGIIMDWKN